MWKAMEGFSKGKGEAMEHSIGKKTVALVAACLMTACLGLTACGGGGSSSAASASGAGSASSESASSASASVSSASTSASSASAGTESFVGAWKLAAAESQGVTMAGNFGEIMGVGEGVSMTVNADGTGKMSLGDEGGDFTWAAESDGTIYVTPQSEEASIQQALPVNLKDGAVFMPYEQDGQEATLIFTKDGTYAGAKVIDVSQGKAITDEKTLLGTWKLSGMDMMGISIYGDAEAIAAMGGGEDSNITFSEGGVLEYAGAQGTWEVGADGATVTITESLAGNGTMPVVLFDDGSIAIDMTEAMQGYEFVAVYTK